jgi:hypothetical protein
VNRDITSLILSAIGVVGIPYYAILFFAPASIAEPLFMMPILLALATFSAFCSIPGLYFASQPWKRNWTRKRLIGFILGVLGVVWLGFLTVIWVRFFFFAPPD